MNLTCPNCNKIIRIEGKGEENFLCPYCGCTIRAMNGWLFSWKMDETTIIKFDKQKKHKRKSAYRYWAIFGGILLIVFLWLFFIHEYIDYRFVLSAKDPFICERFLKNHPNGFFHDEVFNFYDDLAFDNAKTAARDSTNQDSCNCCEFEKYNTKFQNKGKHLKESKVLAEKCYYEKAKRTKKLQYIYDFYNKYPNSKYTVEINKIDSLIFQKLIQRYDSISKKNMNDLYSRMFFKSMLQYMYSSKTSVIKVKFENNVTLKDWNDYSNESRKVCENNIDWEHEEKEYEGIVKPASKPPSLLKEYFDAGNIEKLEQIILTELDSTLYFIFNDHFYKLIGAQNDSLNKKSLQIVINYNIKNFEKNRPSSNFFSDANIITPGLYIWYDKLDSTARKRFKGYLLKISIDWKFEMKIPGSNKTFKFPDYSEPNANINDIETSQECYRKMTEQSFHNFALKIASKFGIKRK